MFDKPDALYTSSNQALVVFQASTVPHLPSCMGVQVFYQLHEEGLLALLDTISRRSKLSTNNRKILHLVNRKLDMRIHIKTGH